MLKYENEGCEWFAIPEPQRRRRLQVRNKWNQAGLSCANLSPRTTIINQKIMQSAHSHPNVTPSLKCALLRYPLFRLSGGGHAKDRLIPTNFATLNT